MSELESQSIDVENNEESYVYIVKKRTKKQYIYIGSIIFLNIYLSGLIYSQKINHLNGEIATINEAKLNTIITTIIVVPLIGLLFGWLISFFPYKNLKYDRKYLYFSSKIIFFIQSLLLISILIELIIISTK